MLRMTSTAREPSPLRREQALHGACERLKMPLIQPLAAARRVYGLDERGAMARGRANGVADASAGGAAEGAGQECVESGRRRRIGGDALAARLKRRTP